LAIPREIYEQTLAHFFEPVRPYLDDPSVTEIMINGPFEIYIERRGKLQRTDATFSSVERLTAAIRNLAQYVGRDVSPTQPVLEGRMPDGSRVEAVLPPASPDGPSIAIRRFSKEPLTLEKLLDFGSLTRDLADTLAVLVACKQNIVIAGGTASGKTSLLNAVSALIDPAERVVVIEDARELQLQLGHVVQLEAQPADERGRGEVSIRKLFKATLRMRPDRIIVGEVRGGEALDLIQAMTSGHGGCLTTVHATHALDTVNRLETLALMSDVELPLYALRSQVASAVNFMLLCARLGDGSRCVTRLVEVDGYEPQGGYRFRDLFVRTYTGRDPDGRIRSELVPTGHLPGCMDLLGGLGLELPRAVLEAARRLEESTAKSGAR
jgi:pilus assembly protein CpaF